MMMKTCFKAIGSLLVLGSLVACDNPGPVQNTAWPYYHGNPEGTHYAPLDQINRSNVNQLEVAWVYDTGDAFAQSDMQANPLIVAGKLFTVSPKGRIICLDPATGVEKWQYDPAEGAPVRTKHRSRGVSYWRNGQDSRLFFTFRQHLMALDAESGQLIETFGVNGRVDMRDGLGRAKKSISVANVTPGVVYKDLLIMGSTGNTPGHVRAYDVRSGKIRWIFHTIPQPGELGYDSWPEGAWKTAKGANVWSGMTLDPARGLVFLPTASAGMGDKDFYGADRHGDNLFGTSLVALDANTGQRIWHFQLVKHDLWDRDLPTPPTLVTVVRDGKEIPALAQPTKAGLLYVFNRETGEPLFDMEARAVPVSDVPGEQAAETQMFPVEPAPFSRQHLTKDLLSQRTPAVAQDVARRFAELSSRGPYDPPSEKGTIIFPGLDGGAEWGGAAYDPESGLLYVNANEMAWILRVKPRPALQSGTGGHALYMNNCAVCHREDRTGSPPEFPSLVQVGDRLPVADMVSIISKGGGRMPGFDHLGPEGALTLATYLAKGGKDSSPPSSEPTPVETFTRAAPSDDYIFDGYTKFLDADGYPAVSPPWGTLNAIDVSTGEYVWKIPFGEYPELAAQGLKNTGSENYGGAVVTKGGLLFIGATVFDNKFRVFDKKTGKLLWETILPAAGLATPATYMADGRQFVVIGAGGGKNTKVQSDGKIIAFALKK